MDTQINRNKIVHFLKSIARPDLPIHTISDGDGLMASGLIDSLATLEIISFLEAEFNIDFSETGIDPVDIESINSILGLIKRHSKHPEGSLAYMYR